MNKPQDYCREVPTSTRPSPQIHIWRMREAVVWNIGLQLVLMLMFTLFLNLNLIHPLTWVGSSVYIFASSWLKILGLVVMIYIQGEICKKDYVTGPVYHATRFQKLKSVFSVRNLLLLLFHMIIGVTTLWIYSSIPGSTFQHFTKPCNINDFSHHLQLCLDEGKVFLLAGGMWLGVYYFTKDYLFGSRNLLFPLIQQHKFYRIKAALIRTILDSILESILPTILFIIAYYICGGYIRSRFMESMSVTSITGVPIDTLQGILNFNLISSLWLHSSLFIVTLKMMELLFNIHLTEQYNFSISLNMVPPGNYLSLLDALKELNIPIIQHLGYLDLFSIATKNIQRREEVFTLSLPGGHPHTWNGIFQESIKLIRAFTNDLSKALQQTSNIDSNHVGLSDPGQKIEMSTFHFHSHNLRKLASPVSRPINTNAVRPNEIQSAVEIGFTNFQSWLSVKLQRFLKKPYISYFFAESSDFRVNYLLCQSQPVIWAAQGISFLSAASLIEDRYGVVQKDLPEIITALVGLKQVLDKLSKQNLIKKSFANDPLEIKMKYLLKTSVKRSLYKIAVTFGPFVKDLRLPSDVELQMNNFITFKEVL